jgi:phenylpropionate dioxygenase-like ring-hydroxylating dioxygenase large terminal subunit
MFQSIKEEPSKQLRPEHSNIRPSDWEVLSKYWYPLARTQDVGDSPIPVTLLDVQLVLFRGDQSMSVLLDRCAHRLVKLSAGKVMNGNIQCPYHALQFSGSGQCVHIPGSLKHTGSKKIPKSYQVQSFPVKEKYGLVWTCLDDTGTTSLPELKGIEDYKLIYNEPRDVPASAYRQIENFFDLGHLPVTHQPSLGGDINTPITPGTVTTEEGIVQLDAEYLEIPLGMGERPCKYTYRVTLPFNMDMTILDDTEVETRFINFVLPYSAHECRAFQILTDTSEAGGLHAGVIDATNTVNDEDKFILTNTPDIPTRLDGRGEMHLAIDNMALAYRKALLELGLGQ